MSREENLLVLKMLQEGTITAEQAAELLHALDASAARSPAPPPPPTPPSPPDRPEEEEESETFARARAKIAAARESVSGAKAPGSEPQDPEKPAESDQEPEGSKEHGTPPRSWEALADALKETPGARSLADALRGVENSRIAAGARRQMRRVARSVRNSLEDLNIPLMSETRGDPTLTVPREVSAAVTAGGTLRIRNPLGGIEVAGADVPEARIAGNLRVWAGNEATAQSLADQVTLTVEQGLDGPTVTVASAAEARSFALDLRVFVPQGITVSLLSPAGKIRARELRGGVALATQSGEVTVQEVAGDVAVETASGDISIEGVMGEVSASSASGQVSLLRISGQNLKAGTQNGDMILRDITTTTTEAKTISGNIEVKTASGRTLRLRTVSGDVAAEDIAADAETHLDTVDGTLTLSPRAPVTGTITLAAVSGDIDLRLPLGVDASLSLSTRSGDIRGRWNGAEGERRLDASGMNSFSETLGSGPGCRITVSTISGDIDVRLPEEEPAK